MSLYNMLFGRNPNTEIILALIGLKQNDVERFRDCDIDYERKQVSIYTRTGGGNREDYPNEKLTSNPYYLDDKDDKFDNTYAMFYFKFPQEIEEDILKLQDIPAHGISGRLIIWITKTSNREKTESDLYTEKREAHERILRDLRLNMDVTHEFNGHTTVPLTDRGMEKILQAAEENEGEFLGSHFGVKPYQLVVRTDEVDRLWGYRKIAIDTTWKLDIERWEYWKTIFGEKYPKAIAKICEQVER